MYADLEESLGTFEVSSLSQRTQLLQRVLAVSSKVFLSPVRKVSLVFLHQYFQSTKAVYNRILDLKISNPQIIINFAVFLEEHRYFEESFKVWLCMYGFYGSIVRVAEFCLAQTFACMESWRT